MCYTITCCAPYKPADASGKEGAMETVKLALLFGAWYLANIYFNMYVRLTLPEYG